MILSWNVSDSNLRVICKLIRVLLLICDNDNKILNISPPLKNLICSFPFAQHSCFKTNVAISSLFTSLPIWHFFHKSPFFLTIQINYHAGTIFKFSIKIEIVYIYCLSSTAEIKKVKELPLAQIFIFFFFIFIPFPIWFPDFIILFKICSKILHTLEIGLTRCYLPKSPFPDSMS